MKPAHELAEVIRLYGDSFSASHDPLKHHQRTLHALSICRTAALGGHVQRCDNPDCKHEILAYNSCRNRHCLYPVTNFQNSSSVCFLKTSYPCPFLDTSLWLWHLPDVSKLPNKLG